MSKNTTRQDAALAPWLANRGLHQADAPTIFRDAAVFYANLARELDRVRDQFSKRTRRDFAHSRRGYLRALLDVALDEVEFLGRVERGEWP